MVFGALPVRAEADVYIVQVHRVHAGPRQLDKRSPECNDARLIGATWCGPRTVTDVFNLLYSTRWDKQAVHALPSYALLCACVLQQAPTY